MARTTAEGDAGSRAARTSAQPSKARPRACTKAATGLGLRAHGGLRHSLSRGFACGLKPSQASFPPSTRASRIHVGLAPRIRRNSAAARERGICPPPPPPQPARTVAARSTAVAASFIPPLYAAEQHVVSRRTGRTGRAALPSAPLGPLRGARAARDTGSSSRSRGRLCGRTRPSSALRRARRRCRA
jgi:hypothetical protein